MLRPPANENTLLMISVIIPTYNRAAFLKEAIESVLNQEYFEKPGQANSFEILVIDGGSTSSTPEIAKSFGGNP